jgi:phenylalanyl-tRNA synthetase beta chain
VLTGQRNATHWQEKSSPVDLFTIKGMVDLLLSSMGLSAASLAEEHPTLGQAIRWSAQGKELGSAGVVTEGLSRRFGIKQAVYYAELNWQLLITLAAGQPIRIRELPRFPSVERDLALVVPTSLPWNSIQGCLEKIRIKTLQDIKVFDIFESDKLGVGKKSIAIHLIFSDPEKTLTDKEIENWIDTIIKTLEKELDVLVRQ